MDTYHTNRIGKLLLIVMLAAITFISSWVVSATVVLTDLQIMACTAHRTAVSGHLLTPEFQPCPQGWEPQVDSQPFS